MNEGLRSVLVGTSALSLVLAVAAVLTALRWRWTADSGLRNRILEIFQLGIALQCLHFLEEYLTGFHLRFPKVLGLPSWSAEFFVTFNVVWLAIWILAAWALRQGSKVGLLPAWFFALGMAGNGVVHPLLALRAGGYFPGLASSPIVGLLGLVLLRGLFRATKSGEYARSTADGVG